MISPMILPLYVKSKNNSNDVLKSHQTELCYKYGLCMTKFILYANVILSEIKYTGGTHFQGMSYLITISTCSRINFFSLKHLCNFKQDLSCTFERTMLSSKEYFVSCVWCLITSLFSRFMSICRFFSSTIREIAVLRSSSKPAEC